MRKSKKDLLELQLEEAIQMLQLVATEERTCVEVREWLEQHYPENTNKEEKSIVDLIMRSRVDS